ncbi:MAG: hypothetical protein AB7V32_01275 [Candidatus Berkiella sp.]
MQIPEKVFKNVVSRMAGYWAPWKEMIEISFLNDSLKNKFQKIIEEKIEKLM